MGPTCRTLLKGLMLPLVELGVGRFHFGLGMRKGKEVSGDHSMVTSQRGPFGREGEGPKRGGRKGRGGIDGVGIRNLR